jgi:hypothetical protein
VPVVAAPTVDYENTFAKPEPDPEPGAEYGDYTASYMDY